MQAQDVMTGYPATLRRTETIAVALQRLAALDVRHLPVVDDVDRLLGMVSERDLLGALGPEGTPEPLIERTFQRPIETVMSAHVLAVDRDTSVADIIDVMTDRKIGAVPVIDEQRVVVGIVSYIDVLRALRGLVAKR